MIHIANRTYEVVVDHKNGWKPEAFRDRYSEVLERYDYIVGDWGYNQLRLRGFFKETHPKATKETSIATLQDYLNEYCNFGCAYFIIERVPNRQHNPLSTQPGHENDEELSAAQEDPLQGAEQVAVAAAVKTAESQQETKPFGQREHREKPHHQKEKAHHHRRSHHPKQGQQGHKSSSPKPPQQQAKHQ